MHTFLSTRDATVYNKPDTLRPKKWHVATYDGNGGFVAACDVGIVLVSGLCIYPQAVDDALICKRRGCRRHLE